MSLMRSSIIAHVDVLSCSTCAVKADDSETEVFSSTVDTDSEHNITVLKHAEMQTSREQRCVRVRERERRGGGGRERERKREREGKSVQKGLYVRVPGGCARVHGHYLHAFCNFCTRFANGFDRNPFVPSTEGRRRRPGTVPVFPSLLQFALFTVNSC